MKEAFLNMFASPRYEKAIQWGKLITVTGFTQSFIQAVGLICGIFIIRFLPTSEYALYTLANAMLATMINLADGGIAASVLAQCGKVWHRPKNLGIVLATGFNLRKKFAIGSLLFAVPILLVLLHHHGSGWLMSCVITFSLIPPFFTTLYGHLLEIIPKLDQNIVQLQKVQALNNSLRLALLVPSILLFPFAFIAVSVTSLPQLWANFRLRKMSANLADKHQQSDPAVEKSIMKFVRRSMPTAIYFSISGQIMIWLVSIFGSTQAVAQVGAIGRLGMALVVFSVIFSTLVSPRFAKMPAEPALLRNRYLQIQVGLIVLSTSIIVITSAFPEAILWILGKEYANLHLELVLGITGSCLNLMVGVTMNLYESRGWVMRPVVSIFANIITLILGILLLNITTLKGIFLFNIFQGSVGIILHFLFGLIMINKSKPEFVSLQ